MKPSNFMAVGEERGSRCVEYVGATRSGVMAATLYPNQRRLHRQSQYLKFGFTAREPT